MITESINKDNMMRILDYVYNQTLNGLSVPGGESYQELAESYLKEKGTLSDKADSLIRWQIAKCATSGFLAGLGGVLSVSVSIPANISSVLYVQLRMIAAIAYMGGYNPKEDKVKTFVYMCLLGGSCEDFLKEKLAIPLGEKLTISFIKSIPGELIKKINQAVGFRLLTKFGEHGIINLGKLTPVVGGFIGGAFDGFTTKAIGGAAKKMFMNNMNNENIKDDEGEKH